MTADNFAVRLTQTNLAAKANIVDFVKETDFHNEVKNLNKRATSNKTKHVLAENEVDELPKKVKVILKKRINKRVYK